MYVLTTAGGGCVVDAVAQVSGGDSPLIAVAVMKKNNTNALMKSNARFALNVLGKDVDPQIIKDFGFRSGRDCDKLDVGYLRDESGVKTVDGALGYMICDKVDAIDNDTHTLFIGRLVEGDVVRGGEPMSYGYYQEHKDELMKVKTESGKTAWVCKICGYVYYGETLPDGYLCPICGVDASFFEKK